MCRHWYISVERWCVIFGIFIARPPGQSSHALTHTERRTHRPLHTECARRSRVTLAPPSRDQALSSPPFSSPPTLVLALLAIFPAIFPAPPKKYRENKCSANSSPFLLLLPLSLCSLWLAVSRSRHLTVCGYPGLRHRSHRLWRVQALLHVARDPLFPFAMQ